MRNRTYHMYTYMTHTRTHYSRFLPVSSIYAMFQIKAGRWWSSTHSWYLLFLWWPVCFTNHRVSSCHMIK